MSGGGVFPGACGRGGRRSKLGVEDMEFPDVLKK